MKGAAVTNEVFLDANYAVALVAEDDQYHAVADRVADRIATEKWRLVTTHAVLLEIGNSLSRRRYRAEAVQLLLQLAGDPTVEIVTLTNELYEAAFQVFQRRPTKNGASSIACRLR